jgi:hypothetical protein
MASYYGRLAPDQICSVETPVMSRLPTPGVGNLVLLLFRPWTLLAILTLLTEARGRALLHLVNV